MKEADVPISKEEEIEYLKTQVKTYEKQLHDMVRPYPAGEVLNMMDWLEGNRIKFGLVSDTHIGSKMARPDCLNAAYEIFDKEGINRVFHTGDMTSGQRVYKGQEHETLIFGFDGQRDAVINQYPSLKEGKTFWILGNHDASHLMLSGADIGTAVGKGRKDLVYLGQIEADIKLARNTVLRLRHPSGGGAYALCFDEKTEILTNEGWKYFKDLNKKEKVATLNPSNHAFEWQKPNDYIEQIYNGNLLHFYAKCFDFLVTPNHRIYIKRYPGRIYRVLNLVFPQKSHLKINTEWHFKEAIELLNCSRQKWQLTKICKNWMGHLTPWINIPVRQPKKYASKIIRHIGKLKIEDIVELIAWYVTEGHIDKQKYVRLSLCQSKRVNPENHQQIIGLLDRIGFKAKGKDRDQKDIEIFSTELCDFLINNCGMGSRYKYLPDWLKDQPVDILKIVFETMIKGDGWSRPFNSYGYKSISKRLLEDLGEIAIKLGYAVNFHKDSCYITQVQSMPTINKNPHLVYYQGKVYCVNVPNGIILVRRNGKTIWSGNSYPMQRYISSLEGGHKPDILAEGHRHTSFQMEYRNIFAFQVPCFEYQSLWLKAKGLQPVTGAWIVDAMINKKGELLRVKTEQIKFK